MSGPHNTGSTMLLEEGMEPKPMTLTAEEAQYIETRKLNREEVCAAYDMPPPVVHILDHATFSNITEQMRSMYRDTMAPRSCRASRRRSRWTCGRPSGPSDDVYAEFLMDEVLRGDFETRQDALAKASHMTIAEKRKVENLPFIEGTDRIFLNAGIAAAGRDRRSGCRDAAQPLAPAETLGRRRSRCSVARSVMGRLSWQHVAGRGRPRGR